MKTSPRGLDLIAKWEGCRLNVYKDAAGKDTIGIGHLVKFGESWPNGITREQAEELLAKDIAWAERGVNRVVSVDLNQQQFDALVSFTFNLGLDAFERSTLLMRVNAARFADVPMELTRWNKAGGKSLLGLARRRVAEAELFLS